MSSFAMPAALVAPAARDGLTHSYILTGAGPSALDRAAAALAAGYLCEEEGRRPCGACKHCRKVARGIHPDVIVVAPEPGKELKVDQIRDLRTDAYIRPNEGRRKVYLLQHAERMNPQAQNAFLKVLEEGPEYAAFVLLSANDLALLPTVRSRCETVRLEPQAEGETDAELERKAGELAGLLLGDDPWRLAGWCVPYEKAKREEIVPLWEATRQALLLYRKSGNTAKAVRLAQTLEEIIAAAGQNGNMGVLWGLLWSRVQTKEV